MKIIEPFEGESIAAECLRYSLGGDPIIVISEPTEEAEVVLDLDEARGLHEWLGRALSRVEGHK